MKVLVSSIAKLQKMERHLLLIKGVIKDIIMSEVATTAPLDQKENAENDVIFPDNKDIVVDEIETGSKNNIVKEKREGSKVKDMIVVMPQLANGNKSTKLLEERQERSRPPAAVRHPLPLLEDREDPAALIEPSSKDVFNEDVQRLRPGVRDRTLPSAKPRIHTGGPVVRQRSRSVNSTRTQTVTEHPPHGLPASSADRIAVNGPINRKTPEVHKSPPPLPLTPPPSRLVRKATSSGLNPRRRSKSASHKSASHKNTLRDLRNDATTPPSQRSEDTSGNDQSSHS
jgi:hypothetical protein